MLFSQKEHASFCGVSVLLLALVLSTIVLFACVNAVEDSSTPFRLEKSAVADGDESKAVYLPSVYVDKANSERLWKRYSNWSGAEWPDLSAPISKLSWEKLVNEQAKDRLLFLDANYPYLSSQVSNSERKAALKKIAESFLGFTQVQLDERVLRIVFPVVSTELEIGKRDRSATAIAPTALTNETAMGKIIEQLIHEPDGAQWVASDPRFDKAKGIYHYDFRLEYQSVVIIGVTLTLSTHVDFDSDIEQLYAVDLRQGKVLENDFNSLTIVPIEKQDGNELCKQAYKQARDDSSEDRDWDKDFTYISCEELDCEVYEKWKSNGEEKVKYSCDILVDKKVVTSIEPLMGLNSKAATTAFIPYLWWQNGRSYGRLQVIQATSTACSPSSTPVRSGTAAVWTDEEGNFTIPSQYVCLVPDAHAASLSDDLSIPGSASKSGFMYCSPDAHTSYADCDETHSGNENDNRDEELWSPPMLSSSPSWTISYSNDLYRDQWSTYYHLNWMRNLFSDLGLSTQCQSYRNGILADVLTKFRVDNNSNDGQTNIGKCSMTIGTNNEQVAPALAYHEYTHLLRKTTEGAAGYTGQQCRLKSTTLNFYGNGKFINSWNERNMHATAYASSVFSNYSYEYPAADSYAFDFSYPLPTGNDPFAGIATGGPIFQLTRTYFDLSWMTSLPSFAKFISSNTGLRPGNTTKCTGPYLSGYAKRDTRVYSDEDGLDTTSACACYRSSSCGCSQAPSQRSEREDVALALGMQGEPYYTFEVDRTFDQWSHEGGTAAERWSDDVTNLWYGGPLITRPRVDFPSNSAYCIRKSPNRSEVPLSLYSSLPNREYDYDNFSFQPGWAKSYSFWAYNQTANTQLWLGVHNKNREGLISTSTCPGGTTGDACKADATSFYDANTTHIRIGEVSWTPKIGPGA